MSTTTESGDCSHAVDVDIPLNDVESPLLEGDTTAAAEIKDRRVGRRCNKNVPISFAVGLALYAIFDYFWKPFILAPLRSHRMQQDLDFLLDTERRQELDLALEQVRRQNRQKQELQRKQHMYAEHHAVELTEETFESFLTEHSTVFVNFYVTWCNSDEMYPMWQAFAQKVQKTQMPIAVGQVNCNTQLKLCARHTLMRFPTLQWFDKLTGFAKGDIRNTPGFYQVPSCRKSYLESLPALQGLDKPVDTTEALSVDYLMSFAKRKVNDTEEHMQGFSKGAVRQQVHRPNNGYHDVTIYLTPANHRNGKGSFRLTPYYANVQTTKLVFDLKRVEAQPPPQVMELTDQNFEKFVQDHDMAFVNFCCFTPDCVWCQQLAPSWEQFAHIIAHDTHLPMMAVGRVNCTAHVEFCEQTHDIHVQPTIRWFLGGMAQAPDYSGSHSIQGLIDFAKAKLEMDEKFNDWNKNAAEEETLPKISVLPERSRGLEESSGYIENLDNVANMAKTTKS